MKEYNYKEAFEEAKRLLVHIGLFTGLLMLTIVLNDIIGAVASIAIALLVTIIYRQVVSALHSPTFIDNVSASNDVFKSNEQGNERSNGSTPGFMSANISFSTSVDNQGINQVNTPTNTTHQGINDNQSISEPVNERDNKSWETFR